MPALTTMVLLAAGMGARFGGPKQLVPVGPAGETILDYNAHDAVAAGFERIVIVTRAELEDEVAAAVDAGVGRLLESHVVCQEIPPGRTKPLGTAHAVVAAARHIDGRFGVANSDDLYGPGAFASIRSAMGDEQAVVSGLPLSETVPREGAVSRAVLDVDEVGQVRRIVEVHGIRRGRDGWKPGQVPGDGGPLHDATFVSMNLWGFPAFVLDALRDAVDRFVASGASDEVFLPEVVGAFLADGRLRVRLVPSPDSWSGLTNPDDLDAVREHARRGWPSPL